MHAPHHRLPLGEQAREVLERNQLDAGYLVVLEMPGRAAFHNGEHTQLIGTVRYTCPVLGESKHGPARPWIRANLGWEIYRITTKPGAR